MKKIPELNKQYLEKKKEENSRYIAKKKREKENRNQELEDLKQANQELQQRVADMEALLSEKDE